MAMIFPRAKARFQRLVVAILGVATLGLAACSDPTGLFRTDDDDTGFLCPRVQIIGDAAQSIVFQPGGGRDLTDIMHRAEIVDFRGGCDYTTDGVDMDFDLLLEAEPGPALQDRTLRYRYFVAILKPDGAPWAKRTFDTEVTLQPGAARGRWIENLVQSLPLPEDVDARDFRVLVGFELTEVQLEYNRGFRQ